MNKHLGNISETPVHHKHLLLYHIKLVQYDSSCTNPELSIQGHTKNNPQFLLISFRDCVPCVAWWQNTSQVYVTWHSRDQDQDQNQDPTLHSCCNSFTVLSLMCPVGTTALALLKIGAQFTHIHNILASESPQMVRTSFKGSLRSSILTFLTQASSPKELLMSSKNGVTDMFSN